MDAAFPPRLVPATTAAIALGGRRRLPVEAALVDVGSGLEVDVDVLAASDPEAAVRVLRYDELCRMALGRTDVPSGLMVEFEVPLVDVAQSTTKGSARDLSDELAALESVPVFAPLLDVLGPVRPSPRRSGGVTVLHRGDRTVARMRVASGVFPLPLGGAPSPWETRRVVEVVASHAAWRDRRLRRLTAVTVTAVERRPDPSVLPA